MKTLSLWIATHCPVCERHLGLPTIQNWCFAPVYSKTSVHYESTLHNGFLLVKVHDGTIRFQADIHPSGVLQDFFYSFDMSPCWLRMELGNVISMEEFKKQLSIIKESMLFV